MTSLRDFERYGQERGSSVTGSEVSFTRKVTNKGTIPIPGWRKITEGDSEDSGAPTYIGDGKMGRAGSRSRGLNAMGVPRTNMSRFFSTSDDMEGTESEGINTVNTVAVSSLCLIYDVDEKG